MIYTPLHSLPKITLVVTICLLVFSTTSCTNNQASPQIEITQAPSPTPISNNNELSTAVKSAVLSDASKRVSKSVGELRITQAEKQSWGDSCLGLAQADKLCAQVIVPGWKVVVTDGKNELVYRTDEKGKQVKLEDLQK